MNTPEDSAQPTQPTDSTDTASEVSTSPVGGHLDPDDPPWGLLQAIPTWAISVLLTLLVPLVCTLPYVLTKYRGTVVTQETLIRDKTYVFILVAGFLPAHLLALALVWAVASRVGKVSPWKTLGLSWPRNLGIWKSAGLALLLFAISWILLLTLGGADTELERILRSSRGAALMMALLATVTAPITEEVIYRGLLYSAIQRWTGAIGAVAIVTLIFGGLHVWQYWPNAGAILAIGVLSLALTAIRARTGRLLPCYVIHLVFNGITAILIVIDPYVQSIQDAPKPDAAPGIIYSLIKFLWS